MLKQTLFIVISICAISHLQAGPAGCFPAYFFADNGAASPSASVKPYYADFPGAQFAGSPKAAQAQRRLSTVIAMMAAVQLVSTPAVQDGETSAARKGEVKN